MRIKPIIRMFCSLLFILILSACSFSLTEDIPPPADDLNAQEEASQLPQPTREPIPTNEELETGSETPDQSAEENTPKNHENLSKTPMDFKGQIINASGGLLPEDLTVTLQAYDGMEPSISLSVEASADGKFFFDDIELAESRVYYATVIYQDLSFSSDVVHALDLDPARPQSLDIDVFDVTQDTDALVTDRLHVFFDFSIPNRVQIASLYLISNPSDLVISGKDSTQPVIEFILPENASGLQFDGGELEQRFILTEIGFGDRMPIPPAKINNEPTQILFAYELPVDKNKMTFTFVPPIKVNTVMIAIPDTGLKVLSPGLTADENSSAMGSEFVIYNGSDFQAGDEIEITISGLSKNNEAANSNLTLAMGGGIFALVLIGLGIWLYKRPDPTELEEVEEFAETEPILTKDEILDAIIALDDLYSSGKLSEDAFRKRRAELKTLLKNILDQEGK
ncbi:MAG: hypothetical protein JEZ06_01395 [Anaerolineaceae bacterium]|nr:hypothetical protein [Anaerolineaceae bacterium]